jgi:hypothetical protein
MKLLSKTISVNDQTFAPEMTVTIVIPVDTFEPYKELTPEKYHEFIGKTLIDLLKNC